MGTGAWHFGHSFDEDGWLMLPVPEEFLDQGYTNNESAARIMTGAPGAEKKIKSRNRPPSRRHDPSRRSAIQNRAGTEPAATFDHVARAPVQLLPPPAAQARQCWPVRIDRSSSISGVRSQRCSDFPFRIRIPSI